ncbi:hypothetical protein [Streptomyces jumonjinensis]|uniref:hypothetical protein n=1 Tax=Streptomyces jumonjinensis TaxID=1945 RepID=UPI001E5A11A1|nr:hypothetical protein [Streptomyces jumonjinensis]
MGTLILQFAGWYADEAIRPPVRDRCELGDGGRAVIGYNAERDVLDIRSAADPVLSAAAVVTARSAHWCLTNLHTEDTYFVENMERGGEFVKVAPRRQDIPIPFELARLVLPVARGAAMVNVFGPEPRFLAAAPAAPGGRTNWPRLDENSAYFRVLVALCEPQLRGYPPGAVPTITDVIARLEGKGRATTLTRAAVNHHINYLATEKLQVTEWAGATGGKRSYWKREAVVAMALRSGLVGEEHLVLLPSRSAAGSGTLLRHAGAEAPVRGAEAPARGTGALAGGADRPDRGVNRPDRGVNRPDRGADRPDPGVSRPDPGVSRPQGPVPSSVPAPRSRPDR